MLNKKFSFNLLIYTWINASALAEAGPVATAALLEQCVIQAARRVAKSPEVFFDHFAHDYVKHGNLELGLTRWTNYLSKRHIIP